MAIANNQIETNENKNKEKEVKQYIVVQIENNNINSNHVKDTFINGIGTSGDQLISLFEINAIVDEKDNT